MDTLNLVRDFRKTLSDGLHTLLWREPTRMAEVVFAGFILGWPAVMLLPSWRVQNNPLAVAMESLAPVPIWGGTLLLLGVGMLLTAIADWTRGRRAFVFASIWFWLFLTVVFWRVNAAFPGRFGCPFAAMVSVQIYWRLGSVLRTERSRRNACQRERGADRGDSGYGGGRISETRRLSAIAPKR